MKPISLSRLESIPTPQANQELLTRQFANRESVVSPSDSHLNSLKKHSGKAKPIARKKLENDDALNQRKQKRKSQIDRENFGEFLQLPDEIKVEINVAQPLSPSPGLSTGDYLSTDAPIIGSQPDQPRLQNTIATIQAKPEQQISLVQFGLPNFEPSLTPQVEQANSPAEIFKLLKVTAEKYHSNKQSLLTDNPESTNETGEANPHDARISSILKKLIQEKSLDLRFSMFGEVSEPVAPAKIPMSIESIIPQVPNPGDNTPNGSIQIDSNLIDQLTTHSAQGTNESSDMSVFRFYERTQTSFNFPIAADPFLATQLVSQIADHFSPDGVETGRLSSREITIQIKPEDLGAIKILVESAEGRLHARIEASELVTSEMLLKEKSQLLNALKDRGLDLQDLDISHGDPQSQHSKNQDHQDPGHRITFPNERRNDRTQSHFNSIEQVTTNPTSTKRFVINVIA